MYPTKGTGFSPWQHANQAAMPDGRCYVSSTATCASMVTPSRWGPTNAASTCWAPEARPQWWMRPNRSGTLEVEDMATDPAGACWVTGTQVPGSWTWWTPRGTHRLLCLPHRPGRHRAATRFGPTVLHSYSVDAAAGLAVPGGEYSNTISFGTQQVTDNLRGMYSPLPVGGGRGRGPCAVRIHRIPQPRTA